MRVFVLLALMYMVGCQMSGAPQVELSDRSRQQIEHRELSQEALRVLVANFYSRFSVKFSKEFLATGVLRDGPSDDEDKTYKNERSLSQVLELEGQNVLSTEFMCLQTRWVLQHVPKHRYLWQKKYTDLDPFAEEFCASLGKDLVSLNSLLVDTVGVLDEESLVALKELMERIPSGGESAKRVFALLSMTLGVTKRYAKSESESSTTALKTLTTSNAEMLAYRRELLGISSGFSAIDDLNGVLFDIIPSAPVGKMRIVPREIADMFADALQRFLQSAAEVAGEYPAGAGPLDDYQRYSDTWKTRPDSVYYLLLNRVVDSEFVRSDSTLSKNKFFEQMKGFAPALLDASLADQIRLVNFAFRLDRFVLASRSFLSSNNEAKRLQKLQERLYELVHHQQRTVLETRNKIRSFPQRIALVSQIFSRTEIEGTTVNRMILRRFYFQAIKDLVENGDRIVDGFYLSRRAQGEAGTAAGLGEFLTYAQGSLQRSDPDAEDIAGRTFEAGIAFLRQLDDHLAAVPKSATEAGAFARTQPPQVVQFFIGKVENYASFFEQYAPKITSTFPTQNEKARREAFVRTALHYREIVKVLKAAIAGND